VPRAREQQKVEPELARHRAIATRNDRWAEAPLEAVPAFLEAGKPAPTLNGSFHSAGSLYTGRAMVKSGFAFLSFFESEGRRFGLSVDLDVMPLDRLDPVVASEFRGLELEEGMSLPVGFVRSKTAALFSGEPRGKGLSLVRPLRHREALPLSGRRERVGTVVYAETRSGEWLQEAELVVVPPMSKRPGWATPGRTWIDISILRQALVAYEGDRAVFVTLVSTGADGLGDPEETHSTIRGQFLIHTKHLTATMPRLRESVACRRALALQLDRPAAAPGLARGDVAARGNAGPHPSVGTPFTRPACARRATRGRGATPGCHR
jgi:hypothetical protein